MLNAYDPTPKYTPNPNPNPNPHPHPHPNPNPNQCGVVAESAAAGAAGAGEELRLLRDGSAFVLDNTFPHYVYNEADAERFVLMVEMYHPALSAHEVAALRTLFALKDRFTVLKLQQCPWGFGEEELFEAIASKRALELEFWRDLAYGL